MVEKMNTEVPRLIIPTITILLVFYRFAPLFTCNVFIKIFFSALYSGFLYVDLKLLLYLNHIFDPTLLKNWYSYP